MNRSKALVLPFSEIRSSDLPLVGGKGANLGELTHAGFPIPPGFCLTTSAFRQFMASVPAVEELYARLDALSTTDLEAVRRTGEQVRSTLLAVPVPAAVAAAVEAQWQTTAPGQAYAVRSSATAEDLPDASFAGQQDTYLNVIGRQNLLDAVRRCWASLFTDRAILYRTRNHFPHRHVELSVVVQQMVSAEASGTLFTADPLTGHRHILTIDASFGLGEALVSGLVTPDAYKVDKRTMRVIDRQVADKQLAIIPDEYGGTRQETLSPEDRTREVLTNEQVIALAGMGLRVEEHYDTPQDIEWALAGGELFLLQTRPITSLYPLNGLSSPDDSLHVFFSMGHQQSMTRAMSPLGLDSIRQLVPGGNRNRSDGIVRANGGRIYVDLTLPLRNPVLGRIVPKALGQMDALAPEAFRQVIRRPEFRRGPGPHISFAAIKVILPVMRRLFLAMWVRDLTGFIPRTNALMDAFIADAECRLSAPSTSRGKLEAILEILPELFPFFLNWAPEAAAGIAATRLLPRLAERRLSEDEREALTLGIPGNVVNEMNLAIGDLADLARQSAGLADWFDELDENAEAWLRQAAAFEGSEPFMTAWEAFLDRYGARGPSEIDIAMPRWAEDPLPVLRVVQEFLKRAPGRHREQLKAFVAGREAAFRKLLAHAGRGPLGRVRTWLYRRLYHVMLEAGGMREHHKFLAVRLLLVVKQTLKKNAAEWVAEGKLAHTDDLWFLTWPELTTVQDGNADGLGERIARRRTDLARFQELTPPLVITSDGEAPAVRYQVDDAPEGSLLGNPVSAGVVEGVVRVIHDPQQETLAPGEILVAKFTDPGWTPLFINAGGLVLEIGGALTHGAVVAREYGIPAVVGVRGAVESLQTGERVRVDGNRGIVERLDNGAS